MSHQRSFNQLKETMITLLNHPPSDGADFFNTAHSVNYDLIYQERLDKLFDCFSDVAHAAELNDRQAVNAALSVAKLRLMSLTHFFTALEDDCISLILQSPAFSPMDNNASVGGGEAALADLAAHSG